MSDILSAAVSALNTKLGAARLDGSAKFVITDEGSLVCDDNGVQAGDRETDVTLQQGLTQRGLVIDAEQWQNSFDPSAVMRWVGSTLASFGNVMTNSVLILITVIFILAENTSFGDKLRLARGDKSSQAWLAEHGKSLSKSSSWTTWYYLFR